MKPAPWFHLIDGRKPLLLLVHGSRLFQIERGLFDALRVDDPDALGEAAALAGAEGPPPAPPLLEPPSALSLNLVKACNLSCSYCYADGGRFGGGGGGRMTREVAATAIDQLIESTTTRRVTVGFLGGEPLLNRDTLHFAVAHARRRAAELSIDVRFSITTNGTLLNAEDCALLRDEGFTVTISIDGGPDVHDALRPYVKGNGSHASVRRSVEPLLKSPGRARIAARATVTQLQLDVCAIVEDIAALGFEQIGVSPLRSSSQPGLALRASDWSRLLEAMRHAAAADWSRLEDGRPLRFANFANALAELHKGSCRPLPCGAGGNYASVSVEGNYFTCHRTIDHAGLELGDLASGVEAGKQARFLATRHVDSQQPCASCWARYLCGGGCHAEVMELGRDGCDYVRGWLETCIDYHDRLFDEHPDHHALVKERA